MYITDNVYLIHTRKREKKKRSNTQYRWRESTWTRLICAIESLYRSRFFEARRKRDIKRPKNITFEEIYPDGNRGNRLYSPVIYHFLSTRMQPRPQQCGIIYIYKRHRSLFKTKRRKKSRSENHFSRNDRVHDYFGMKRLRRREENSYGGGTRKEKRIAWSFV